MFKKLGLLLSGYAASSALFMLRSLIIARLITVSEYGIAATFGMVIAVTEMLSALGLQQQLVQAKDGNDPKLQSALQGFHLLRGTFSAIIIVALAFPVANFMRVPQVAPAYMMLGLYPLIFGFTHYDVFRQSRDMRFGPVVAVNVLPPLISVVSLFVLYFAFADYRIMLAAMLVQAFVYVLVSHLTAHRKYSVRLDRAVITRSMKFGWPLLLNSILLFLVFQGDKTIVGRELGLEALGLLSMGFTLTLAPTLLISKTTQNFFLPQLSKVQSDAIAFAPLARTVVQAVMLVSIALLSIIVVFGGPFVLVILGERYGALPDILILLGVLQTIRVFKAGPTVVAMSQAFTSNAMLANLTRLASLPIAWWAAVSGYDLRAIIAIAIVGECVGFAISVALICRRQAMAWRPMAMPVLTTWAFVLGVTLYAVLMPLEIVIQIAPAWCFLGLSVGLAVVFTTMRDLRNYLHQHRKATV